MVLDEDNYYYQMKIEDLTCDSLYLFATHAHRVAYNEKIFAEIASDDNPLAVITAQDESSGCANTFSSRHLKKAFDLKNTVMPRSYGRILSDVKPLWGLYNGTIGRVVDILYTKNKIQTVAICPRLLLSISNNIVDLTFIYHHSRKETISVVAQDDKFLYIWLGQKQVIPMRVKMKVQHQWANLTMQ
jgi:hypothetical protein